jgi:ribosomal protein L18E
MNWKTYIENQALQGRITPEWKALIVTTAEQAVEEYKVELMKEINTLLEKSKSKRDTINDECINPYFARLDTFEEIIKLINK